MVKTQLANGIKFETQRDAGKKEKNINKKREAIRNNKVLGKSSIKKNWGHFLNPIDIHLLAVNCKL